MLAVVILKRSSIEGNLAGRKPVLLVIFVEYFTYITSCNSFHIEIVIETWNTYPQNFGTFKTHIIKNNNQKDARKFANII